MEPLTPPSLDEIHEIVERRTQRRRQAFRATQVGVAGVMVGALFLGARTRTGGSVERTEPADSDSASSDGAASDGSAPGIGSEVVPTDDSDDTGAQTADGTAGERRPEDPSDDGFLPSDTDPAAVDGAEASRLFNLGAFWGAGFDYEQVVVLAEAWNLPELDAKAEAGALIAVGREADVSAVVGEPDGPFPGEFDPAFLDVPTELDYLAGAFSGAGYSLEQAEALAAEWSLPQYEAKATAGRLVLLGRSAEVTDVVGEGAQG